MNTSRKIFYTVSTQLIVSLLFWFVVGVIGLLVGMTYGGNFGFFDFMGLPGYEGGGLFGAVIGQYLGIWLGIVLGGAICKQTGENTKAAMVCLIAALVTVCIGLWSNPSNGVLENVVLFAQLGVAIAALYSWHYKQL